MRRRRCILVEAQMMKLHLRALISTEVTRNRNAHEGKEATWRSTYVKGSLEKYPSRLLLYVKVVEIISLEWCCQAVADRAVVVGVLVRS